MVQERKIEFNSYDGTKLVGIISLPTKIEHALLLVHGIPSWKDEWGFYRDMETSNDMVTFFYNKNVATFRFDLRYMPDGESQTGNLSDLTLSEMLNDIDSAYWKFIEELKGTVKSISIVGTSCGGGVSVKWSNIFKRPVNKIFLNAPVLDYEYEVTGESRKDITKYASLSSDNLKKLSQDKYLNPDGNFGYQMINEAHLFDIQSEFSQCKVPITIFHGDADVSVPYHLTTENIVGFENIELITIPDAGHGFAVEGDDDLTAEGTKANHNTVYNGMYERLQYGK